MYSGINQDIHFDRNKKLNSKVFCFGKDFQFDK